MKILTIEQDKFDQRFFIDCPVRTVVEGEKLVRMEIPQALAKYINNLQRRIDQLEAEAKDENN